MIDNTYSLEEVILMLGVHNLGNLPVWVDYWACQGNIGFETLDEEMEQHRYGCYTIRNKRGTDSLRLADCEKCIIVGKTLRKHTIVVLLILAM